MKRYAIYSVLVGKDYDSIQQPKIVDERFDYLLFSNDIGQSKVGVWSIRPIPYFNKNKILIARYVKTHPETLLKEYEATVFHDANLSITDDYLYKRFFELLASEVEWAGIKHPVRHCIYRESYTMSNWRFEHDYKAFVLCHFMYKEKFPQNFGMYETNVLFRKNNNTIEETDKLWWSLISSFSHRDQFTLSYVLWSRNIPFNYILPEGEHGQNSTHLGFSGHGKGARRKITKIGLFEYIRFKCRCFSDKTEEDNFKTWLKLMRLPFPRVTLFLWGLAQCFTLISITPGLLARRFNKFQ